MERTHGLFHLGLNASQGASSQNINSRINVVHKLRREIPGRFTYLAASNLLGVFLFYDKRISEAIDVFKMILSVDEQNLNAIANLIFVYERLQLHKMAKRYEEIQKGNLDVTDTMNAVFLAEQGFAYRFDCYLEKDEMERCQKSIDLYHESLEVLTPCGIFVEINYWLVQVLEQKFKACVRRGDDEAKWDSYNEGVQRMKDMLIILGHVPSNDATNQERAEKYENKDNDQIGDESIKNPNVPETPELREQFKTEEVSQECPINHCTTTVPAIKADGLKEREDVIVHNNFLTVVLEDNLSLSIENQKCTCDGKKFWHGMVKTWLGSYLSKNPSSYWDETGKLIHVNDIPDIVRKCAFESFFRDPESTFIEAISIIESVQCLNPHHTRGNESRIRYALFLRNKRRNLEKAAALLDEVLSDHTADTDWFALVIRSQINESRAKKLLENELELAEQLLNDSIRDAIKGLNLIGNASEYARLGEMYRTKAMKIDSIEEREISKLKASENFLYAVQSIHEEKRPEIHRMHGVFFRSFEEDRQAVECFKRGIAMDTAERETYTFRYLFEMFLSMHQKSKGTVTSKETKVEDQDGSSTIEEATMTTRGKTGDQIVQPPSASNQNVLYEMVYWFKFAFERYCKNDTSFGRANKNPRKLHDMKKIVSKFITDHAETMSEVAAYFDVVLKKTEICEYIKSCFPGEEQEWSSLFEPAVLKWSEKHPYTDKKESSNICDFCGNNITTLSRQSSTFPGPHSKARNLAYEYDFYVIYSKGDEDWVLFYLLTGLETTYGFKGAISERDFHPGSKTLDEINRIFDMSFKVLLILSENFNKDPMCSFGMHQAMTKQLRGNSVQDDTSRSGNYIIPIIKERCSIPQELLLLHAMDAAVDLDWEKLAFSLESGIST